MVGVKLSTTIMMTRIIVCMGLIGATWSGSQGWAADAGTLAQKDGKYVFVEDQDPAMKLLLERAVSQGLISQEEHDDVVRRSEERAYLLSPSFKAWYDRGFNFSMNDGAFFLKIRGLFQTRFTLRHRNEAWRNPGEAKNYPALLGVFGDYRANRSEPDSSQFTVRRARMYFAGHLFNPDFRYVIQMRAETQENAQAPGFFQLFDYYVLQTSIPWFNVQFGQYKVFFNRSQINFPAQMQFSERSLVSDAFTASGLDRRDIGLTIMNDPEVYAVNYYFGVLNGAGPNLNRFGPFLSEEIIEGCPGGATGGNPFPSPNPPACPTNQRNLNANTHIDMAHLMLTARLMWNIMGRPGYSEGDLVYSETPQFAIGGGYSYNPSINTSTNNSFVGIDLANLHYRRQLAAFGNGRQLGWGIVDYSTWSADFTFKYRGFSLLGEYYFKNVTRHEKGLPCVRAVTGSDPSTGCAAFAPGLLGNATGWYVQTGYYLIPRVLEVAGRYAYWDPDTNAADDLIKEVNVALNWNLSGTYDHRIMLTYTNLAMGTGGYAIGRSNPLPPGSGTVPVDARRGTLVENNIRIMYQLFF